MQRKVANIEARNDDEVRELISKNRQLYIRADEMRKEYHRINAENQELRIDLGRRDTMLAESRVLIRELQRRLRELGVMNGSKLTMSTKQDSPVSQKEVSPIHAEAANSESFNVAKSKRQSSASDRACGFYGTPLPGKREPIFKVVEKPKRVFDRKGVAHLATWQSKVQQSPNQRPSSARAVLQELEPNQPAAFIARTLKGNNRELKDSPPSDTTDAHRGAASLTTSHVISV